MIENLKNWFIILSKDNQNFQFWDDLSQRKKNNEQLNLSDNITVALGIYETLKDLEVL